MSRFCNTFAFQPSRSDLSYGRVSRLVFEVKRVDSQLLKTSEKRIGTADEPGAADEEMNGLMNVFPSESQTDRQRHTDS